METIISIILLIVLIVMGVDIVFAFGGAIVWMVFVAGYKSSFLFPTGFSKLSGVVLLAIPIFIIAGNIMNRGKIGGALIDFVRLFVGRIKGGLAIVAVVASAAFGSISGSGTATLSCIGSIMSPILEKLNYPKGITASIICCSAPLGLLIPPSSIQILYAWAGQLSVLACFLATLLPGLLLTLLLSIGSWILLRKCPDIHPDDKKSSVEWRHQFSETTKRAIPALLMPVIILGGIYSGMFTPTEAATVSAIYAIPVAVWVYKGIRFVELKDVFIESASTIGVVMAMFILVVIYGQMLVREDLPSYLTKILFQVSDNPMIILLMLNIFMIIIGMIMDDISGVLIVTPVLLPVVKAIGVDPIHFAAILGVNLGMGNITPPNAPFIYLAARICNAEAIDMLKPCFFLMGFAYIPTLIVTTLFPEFALFLPRLILGI